MVERRPEPRATREREKSKREKRETSKRGRGRTSAATHDGDALGAGILGLRADELAFELLDFCSQLLFHTLPLRLLRGVPAF